ncbi:MAG: hypothetical protein LBL24_07570, partial [Bacteroidales bacterium]|nr:hypothetical protein [Bacteroidales bacterium]
HKASNKDGEQKEFVFHDAIFVKRCKGSNKKFTFYMFWQKNFVSPFRRVQNGTPVMTDEPTVISGGSRFEIKQIFVDGQVRLRES